MNDRRYYDHSALKSLYHKLTPWVQIAGFILMCAFVVGGKSNEFSAYGATLQEHDKRLAALESKADIVNQKLDDMIAFFGIPHKGGTYVGH